MEKPFARYLPSATLVFLLSAGLAALPAADDPPQFSDWSVPVNLGPIVNSATGDFFPFISKDGLSLYFTSPRPDGLGGFDIYVSRRASANDAWGPAENLGGNINTPYTEVGASLSPDGHRLYFASDRPGGFGGNDIYVSRRQDTRDDFGWQPPQNLGSGVNTDANEAMPRIFDDDSSGGVTLYFDSNRLGGLGPFPDPDVVHNGTDVYTSTLLPGETFGPATLVWELSTIYIDRGVAIRRDGLELFMSSNRPGTVGLLDIWTSTRPTTADPWSTPENLGSVVNSSTNNEAGPALSFRGAELYFNTVRPGGLGAFDLFVTTRTKLKEPD